ncbi:hypothetical protein cand_005080 [Cryptosporidium andersoni]|uniref:Serine aminopeptidase S33 domain-containing protein n=1 Tax=Cryptosporidium andersoni TaxID=117008 RepID=A0A1J4MJK2_9CRYT|nr:hypothetical protein cand_005080 [Cryptosporidium andersoni]
MASLLCSVSSQYNELWRAIIRPPRDKYNIRDLGPIRFAIGRSKFKRTDFTLRNNRHQLLHCSHFEPIESERAMIKLPCVIYLHGNCSSRREAIPYIPLILPLSITVLTVDLSGSGLSEGEYISLGYYEKDDLATLIDYLWKSNRCSGVGIWGRSMGAATALMYGSTEKSDFLKGIVVDSSFSSLRQLCHELVHLYVPLLPNFLVDSALSFIQTTIMEKAKANIDDMAPIKYVKQSKVPSLFIAGTNDNFIAPSHSKTLHDSYGGDKMLMIIPGNHNSERPKFVKASIVIFFYKIFNCEKIPKAIESLRLFINVDIKGLTSPPFVLEMIPRGPKEFSNQAFMAIQQYIRQDVNKQLNTPLKSKIQDTDNKIKYKSPERKTKIHMRPPDVDKYIDHIIPLSNEASSYESDTCYSRSSTYEIINPNVERKESSTTILTQEDPMDIYNHSIHAKKLYQTPPSYRVDKITMPSSPLINNQTFNINYRVPIINRIKSDTKHLMKHSSI